MRLRDVHVILLTHKFMGQRQSATVSRARHAGLTGTPADAYASAATADG